MQGRPVCLSVHWPYSTNSKCSHTLYYNIFIVGCILLYIVCLYCLFILSVIYIYIYISGILLLLQSVMATSRTVGIVNVVIVTTIFVYYTLWSVVTPLLEADNSLHSYFPNREYAVLIPCTFLVVFISMLGIVISRTMIRGPQG